MQLSTYKLMLVCGYEVWDRSVKEEERTGGIPKERNISDNRNNAEYNTKITIT